MEPDLHRPPRRPVEPECRRWRRRVLLQAGFDEPLAQWLAGDAAVDLHDLLKLVDNGCPPATAARILAPL